MVENNSDNASFQNKNRSQNRSNKQQTSDGSARSNIAEDTDSDVRRGASNNTYEGTSTSPEVEGRSRFAHSLDRVKEMHIPENITQKVNDMHLNEAFNELKVGFSEAWKNVRESVVRAVSKMNSQEQSENSSTSSTSRSSQQSQTGSNSNIQQSIH